MVVSFPIGDQDLSSFITADTIDAQDEADEETMKRHIDKM